MSEAAKVLEFKGITTQDIPVDRVLNAAKECDHVLIIGLKDGEPRYYSSSADRYQMLWLLERLKLRLLTEQGDGQMFSGV